MRLLNAKTLVLEEYFEQNVPPYAILSHRWRGGEVSFQDIQGPPPKHKAGYEKVRQTCLRALDDGLTHAWVDTCCIDKSSSAELSESINAMFQWYQKAAVCYAYLADVELLPDKSDQASTLARSEWFERGWTLQELLAPTKLVFYSSNWSLIGNREVFLDPIEERTGIDRQFLTFLGRKEGHSIHEASIAERMSWASSRRTTRSEDVAYCMLGIFGISMPLLYGEGEAAFIRLQEELIKYSDDQTIFAWDLPQHDITENLSTPDARSEHSYKGGCLAKSPAAFAKRGNLIPRRGNFATAPFSVTNKGVAIGGPFCITGYGGLYLMLLCGPRSDPTVMIALPLWDVGCNQYARGEEQPTEISYNEWRAWPGRQVHLLVRRVPPAHDRGYGDGGICVRRIPHGFQFSDASPPDHWSSRSRIFNASLSWGVLNAARPSPTFVLRPLGGQRSPSSIHVSFVARALPSCITQGLGIKPFRIRCAPVSMPNADGAAQNMGKPAIASYVRLSDGSFLYVEMSQWNILDKQFLIIDIKVTRHCVRKLILLLKHSFIDLLSLPFSFPVSPEAGNWIRFDDMLWNYLWKVFLALNLKYWFLQRLLSGCRPAFIRFFWFMYSVIVNPDHIIVHTIAGFNAMFIPNSLIAYHLLIPRRFWIYFLGLWTVSLPLSEGELWSILIMVALWVMAVAAFFWWAWKRNNVLPQNYQHREQKLTSLFLPSRVLVYIIFEIVIALFKP